MKQIWGVDDATFPFVPKGQKPDSGSWCGKFLTAMGLFMGQPKAFFELLQDLAAEADNAKRHGGGGDD